MTFVAALRHDRVDAPWLLKGPINGDCFRTYVKEVLAPTLRPGDIVVLDNLGSHKSKAVRHAIRKAGARLLFLPKYSPDLNPCMDGSCGSATVNGLRFHFVRGGADVARTVVLLAGFPESWFAWRNVMPLLGATTHVIAIDLPGQGDSDRPLDGYDTQTVAERVHGLVRHLGLERYSLVAHDVGAWVAFPYGILFGDEIEALVLMDAGIPGITLPDMLPSAPDKAWKTWHFAFHAVPDLPETLIEGREMAYLDWFFRHKTANPNCYGAVERAEYLRIFCAPGGMRAGLAFYRAAARSAEQNRRLTDQRKFSMPVLGLSADQGSIADIAALIGPYATDVRGDMITHCGHFQPEEQPQVVAAALTRFFDAVLTG